MSNIRRLFSCQKLLILGMIVIFTAPSTSFAESHFPVYDALRTKNKPDLSQFGLIPLRVVYSAELWVGNESRNEPNAAKIRSVANTLPPDVPVCIDIEHWPVTGKPATVYSTITKLNQVVSVVRESQPTCKIGFYGLLPVRDYWRAIGDKGWKMRDVWLRENMRLRQLSNSIDIVFPSLYTPYNDPERWEKYAIQNILEAKKYGKPVYVFLWPIFNGTALAGQYIPASFWRLQLETCRKYADGIVIWDKPTSVWDDRAAWWLETQKFIQSN